MSFLKNNSENLDSHIVILNFNDIIHIIIREPLTYNNFVKELNQKLPKEDFKYVKINQLYNKTIEGFFIIVKGVRKSFNVLINEKYYYLSKNIIHLDKIRQVTLLSNTIDKFEITEKINTKETGSFYRKFDRNFERKIFPRKNALHIAYKLLRDLNGIKELKDIVNLDFAWIDTKLMTKEDYNPIAEDNVISLSKQKDKSQNIISCNIVLKETNEIIGTIAWVPERTYFTYDGGISYTILPEFNNQGYATKSLKLLLEYLAKIDVPHIFIATYKDNLASQKVIEKNNGKLILDSYTNNSKSEEMDSIEKVRVYKFDLKK